MISTENQKLMSEIGVPKEYSENVSRIVEECRRYAKEKSYYPMKFGPAIIKNKYFCAYKQGAASRGEGAAIIGFSNSGGLFLVFHHFIVDLKNVTTQTTTDKQNGWRRVLIDRVFTDEEINYLCKLSFQCFDKAFR